MDGKGGDESLLSVEGRGREGGNQYIPLHINRLQQVLVNVCCCIVPAPRLGKAGNGKAASPGCNGQMPLHFGGLCKLPGINKGGRNSDPHAPSHFPHF